MIYAGLFAFTLLATFVYLNERFHLLSDDRFPTLAHRLFAYLWFGGLLFLVATLVSDASSAEATPEMLARMPFWTLFSLHAILLVFLLGWWLATSTPPLPRFFNLQGSVGRGLALGLAAGVGGWVITITVALMLGVLLSASGLVPQQVEAPPMIAWMAALPVWQKGIIVLVAMTVEELFFRGWLQKRVGVLASTALFALGHAGYGQPLMLIGVTVVSLVIGYTFYRTKSLLPCMIAHGVFDSIQIFVIVPVAMKFMK